MLDEVQMLSNSILEDMRLLFSFNMDSENPYILILSGQTQLRNKLHFSINAPLKQRIAIAGKNENIFTQSAIDAIYSNSKGIPRLVNNLATASLMYACSVKKAEIDEEIVYQGAKDFEI